MEANTEKRDIILTSAFFGMVIAFLICFLPHLSTEDKMFMPESNGFGYYYGSDKVSYATYKCLFGERHSLNTSNITVAGVSDAESENVLADAFEHFPLMLIITLVSTVLISIIWIQSSDQEKFKAIK